MINKILDGISNALNEEFGDEYEIYSEDIPQDFKEPCFFILCLNPAENQIVGKRYHRTHQFDVQYFPRDFKNKFSDIYEIQSRLTDCLEYVNVKEGILRGIKRRGEIVDKVLHFFVNYNIHVIKDDDDSEYIGDLKADVQIRGGE